jgi:hypothetical protein
VFVSFALDSGGKSTAASAECDTANRPTTSRHIATGSTRSSESAASRSFGYHNGMAKVLVVSVFSLNMNKYYIFVKHSLINYFTDKI